MSQIPTITAFKQSPDKGQGLARDMGVRWALEEVGQTYKVRLVTFQELKEPAHLVLHPFGKIPTYEEGKIAIFESGAIVLHIAKTRSGLLPEDEATRERAITWIFSALSTVEPSIIELSAATLFEKDKIWYEDRQVMLQNNVRARLRQLSNYLADKEWLVGSFSAGDVVMITVLRRLKKSGLLNEFANIAAYVSRGESRPAFERAFAAQLAVYKDSVPS